MSQQRCVLEGLAQLWRGEQEPLSVGTSRIMADPHLLSLVLMGSASLQLLLWIRQSSLSVADFYDSIVPAGRGHTASTSVPMQQLLGWSSLTWISLWVGRSRVLQSGRSPEVSAALQCCWHGNTTTWYTLICLVSFAFLNAAQTLWTCSSRLNTFSIIYLIVKFLNRFSLFRVSSL